MESILGSKFAGGRKKVPYNREEATVAVKVAQQGGGVQEIHDALLKAKVGPPRTIASVGHLVRNRLRPITSMKEFDEIFPKGGEAQQYNIDPTEDLEPNFDDDVEEAV